jgi:hypothetical protein
LTMSSGGFGASGSVSSSVLHHRPLAPLYL